MTFGVANESLLALFPKLKKIHSFAPPAALGFSISVTGEQSSELVKVRPVIIELVRSVLRTPAFTLSLNMAGLLTLLGSFPHT